MNDSIILTYNRISLIPSDTARNTVKGPLRIVRGITQQAPMGAVRSKFHSYTFSTIVAFIAISVSILSRFISKLRVECFTNMPE